MRKDIFVLNPAAGKPGQNTGLDEKIHHAAGAQQLDYVIVETKYKGHAQALVGQFAQENKDRVCRFYACGGDGTLNEVVSGAAGCENAEVACYPCGTGNDFIRIFDENQHFLDFERLIQGETMPFDVMQMNDRYAINVCSAGVDARIADWVNRYKSKLPGGGWLYKFSLVLHFFGKLHREFAVEIDGEKLDGSYTIIVAASGRYYGGGFYAVPEAEPCDGLIDFLLIRKIGHLALLRHVGGYQKGRHNDMWKYQEYRRGKHMKLTAKKAEPFNFDGEMLHENTVEISLAPRRLPLVIPVGSKLLPSEVINGRKQAKTRVKNSI